MKNRDPQLVFCVDFYGSALRKSKDKARKASRVEIRIRSLLCIVCRAFVSASLRAWEKWKDLYQNFPCQFESGWDADGCSEPKRCPVGAKEIACGCLGGKEINRRARRAAHRHDDRRSPSRLGRADGHRSGGARRRPPLRGLVVRPVSICTL